MKKSLLIAIAIMLTCAAMARRGDGARRPIESADIGSRAAGCSPANEMVFLEFNNIRTIVETGGLLWRDRANDRASYEYPQGSGNYLIYSGALWMGGEDINGQLKLAGHLFRERGNDFWAGALGQLDSNDIVYDPFVPQTAETELFRRSGAAEIVPGQCTDYDQFYTIRKSEVLQFIAWWNCDQGISDPEDCEGVLEPDPEVMKRIEDWPAHGKTEFGEDYYLAPFYDNNNDGHYNPNDGDYPWYDIEGDIACKSDRRVSLYGDETHWWVFNDKGNIHTETGGDPIGMEVRAQAFSFATDDEINDMTFYNYELINRGTQTLYETYFGQFVDADVGESEDDYVGCDVSRGLGYVYNADGYDAGGEGGQPGYGSTIPAVGVDFFEGPYLDNDNRDNPIYKTTTDSCSGPVSLSDVEANNGIAYAGLGIGYGDCIPDNERFGMQRFVYFDRLATDNYSDPREAADFYNYMKGVWKNGDPMTYGGTGQSAGGVPTRYMFPGDSDPLGYGTYPSAVGADNDWSELTEGNPGGDKRFVQSAGPFTLKPGAVNNITVGVVIGQSSESDIEAPVRALKKADSKAQALFDNCFELIEPPFAPELTIQEMENELILFLSDPPGPDLLENYEAEDYRIDTAYSDNKYRFEGFQVYQMVNSTASVGDIGDLSKARLVAQSDVQNGVGRMVNYNYDEELDITIPSVMVEPAQGGELDAGLMRTFRITEDQFASGDRKLVNHKKYYYIAVSYAYNQFKEYKPDDPTLLDGQKIPYLRSRIRGNGKSIEAVIGIPHDPSPEADGRVFTTTYGYQPEITQIEGLGNGGNFLELTPQTVNEILANNSVDHPTYQVGAGPIDVKVIDPLAVKGGSYTLAFGSDSSTINEDRWHLIRCTADNCDTVYSEMTIGNLREQMIPEWGLSVTVRQQYIDGYGINGYMEPIGATITYADSSKIWYASVEDTDEFYPSNWIRVGSTEGYDDENPDPANNNAYNWIYQPAHYQDFIMDRTNQYYEQLLDGGIAPFKFVGKGPYGNPFGFPGEEPLIVEDGATVSDPWYIGNQSWFSAAGSIQNQIKLENVHDVDIIITSDKSKWTRCPVIEINDNPNQTEHGENILEPRKDASVDKNGKSVAEGGNPAEANFDFETGMGWFPGYAIDVNTGSRLNMMFAENSWLDGDNGNDMVWNPTSNYQVDFDGPADVPVFGGMHYIYVFGDESMEVDEAVPYDQGRWIREALDYDLSGSIANRRSNYNAVWKSCAWVLAPMLAEGQELLATDVKISARINHSYKERAVNGENESFPMYTFELEDPSVTNDSERLISVIDNINIVPNPYYAFSEYEEGKRDNRVKITNLPERCEITIFNMQGALVRSFVKDDPLTSIDWDLRNHQSIPIAGGMYIIHIKIEIPDETGALVEHEKILKWFGALRQPDLDNL